MIIRQRLLCRFSSVAVVTPHACVGSERELVALNHDGFHARAHEELCGGVLQEDGLVDPDVRQEER